MSFVFLQTWNFRSLYVSVFEFHFLTKLVKICSKWKGLTQEESRGLDRRSRPSVTVIHLLAFCCYTATKTGLTIVCVRRARPCTHTKSGVAGIMSISRRATAGSSLSFSGCAEVGLVDRQLASRHRNLQLTLTFLFTVTATLTFYFTRCVAKSQPYCSRHAQKKKWVYLFHSLYIYLFTNFVPLTKMIFP